MNDKSRRLDIFWEKHIGFGVRWRQWKYWLDLSFAFPFFTITVGLGPEL
jgi:hypothetical protein